MPRIDFNGCDCQYLSQMTRNWVDRCRVCEDMGRKGIALQETYFNVEREWRFTLNASGIESVEDRQGYYVKGYSLYHAIETIQRREDIAPRNANETWDVVVVGATRFRTPTFTIQLWK